MNTEKIKEFVRANTALVLIAGAVVLALLLLVSGPSTRRQSAERLAPVVRVIGLDRGSFDRVVESYGTTVPAQEVMLTPQVRGRVQYVSPNLIPGATLEKGEVLVRVERSEYELAVATARATLEQARANFELEQGKQRVAKREWELFGKQAGSGESDSSLALRQPQLAQAQAQLEAAKSALERAELDLSRTSLRAPFDAIIVEKMVNVGQIIEPEARLVHLVGTEEFWVKALVSLAQLDAAQEGASHEGGVRIFHERGLGEVVERSGRFIRAMGHLDPASRMAEVLVGLTDPLAIAESAPRIPLNSYVRVEIRAGKLENIVRLPRVAMRENDEVWVVDSSDKLRVRKVQVLWRQGETLAVRGEFDDSDRVIVSPLANATPGIDLRTKAGAESASAADAVVIE